MIPRFPSTQEGVLDRLRRHVPVPNHTVRMQLMLRWGVTWGMICLLPLSLVMTWAPQWFLAVSGWAVGGLGCVGLLALVIGALARQRHGFNRQWGLAPLDDTEARELAEISERHPEIQTVVDEWLDRWIRSRSDLRGVDLMLLRRGVSAYERARVRVPPAPSRASTMPPVVPVTPPG